MTSTSKTIKTRKARRTISRAELSNIRMAAGNEKTISRVIDGGKVKEWVGIGWIELRRATSRDKQIYLEAI